MGAQRYMLLHLLFLNAAILRNVDARAVCVSHFWARDSGATELLRRGTKCTSEFHSIHRSHSQSQAGQTILVALVNRARNSLTIAGNSCRDGPSSEGSR